ncbi:hypothetical protein P886_2102 [Alteromonadaceae bacterium 2753L.S.0a.02]|nr:hypothetical protein P886_2102 [Alteromonadaceae bacterium 2753L.S.0a.02]
MRASRENQHSPGASEAKRPDSQKRSVPSRHRRCRSRSHTKCASPKPPSGSRYTLLREALVIPPVAPPGALIRLAAVNKHQALFLPGASEAKRPDSQKRSVPSRHRRCCSRSPQSVRPRSHPRVALIRLAAVNKHQALFRLGASKAKRPDSQKRSVPSRHRRRCSRSPQSVRPRSHPRVALIRLAAVNKR